MTLRYAFYRFLAQGLRRCQGQVAFPVSLAGYPPKGRHWFSGEPVWEIDGQATSQPWGYYRSVDPQTGAVQWMYGGQPAVYDDGSYVWDSAQLWSGLETRDANDANRVAGPS